MKGLARSISRACSLIAHKRRARTHLLAKAFRLLLPTATSPLSLPPPPPAPRTQRVRQSHAPLRLTTKDRQQAATARQQAATALRATNHFNNMLAPSPGEGSVDADDARIAALFASHVGAVFPDPSDPMEIAASHGLLSPFMPSILGPNPYTHTHLPPHTTSTTYPYTHTHFPRNTTSTSRYHSQYQEPAPTSHAALLRSPASPVSTGGGAPVHAREVTVTSLSGVQLSTPNQPNVNSKYIRYPHADSDTTYYGELTPPPSSLHTPSPSSPTYARPETATTQRLQRRLHSTLPRHERARRDRLLAETPRLPPTIFQVDHVMGRLR